MTREDDPRVGSTQRLDEARATITRTTITPAPGSEVVEAPAAKRGVFDRVKSRTHGELSSAEEPFAAASTLRIAMAVMMTGLWILTIGGAILVLLLWQQDRDSGVLTDQLERTWNLFDGLRVVERWLAFAVIPVATAWIAVAAINARRATGVRRNPIVAALSLPIGVIGAWFVGRELVGGADDWVGQVSGYVLQCVFLAVPLLALLRVAQAAESRNRPLRATYLVAAGYLAQLQFLGGLSTIDQTSPPDEWGRLGAYLIIGGLLQVLGALSVNEAARSIETATAHRYELRNRFGESLLAQAERGSARG
ncbi:MAG: hypothetical protein R8G01_07905 [Ilumatobacteraceae bacterium]|nr:hypothetical protein [Ilumatobacteraceae bacterium]